jgi:REP element-mobilizing transposase RayT
MNKYNPNIHHRRSIRLKGYDYSQAGLYFITICVKNRECLFGNIVEASLVDVQNTDAQINLNDAGKMVEEEWLKLPQRFNNIKLHKYIVMPNHFHAILEITATQNKMENNVGVSLVDTQNDVDTRNDVDTQNDVDTRNDDLTQTGQPQGIAPTNKTVGDMVGAFESITTVEYIRGVKQNGWQPFDGKLWQRNYWEHIIRNENEYNRISQYIINNPSKWENDKLNDGKGNTVMEPMVEYNSEIWMI